MNMDELSERSRRIRTLTQKGTELFQSSVERQVQHLRIIEREIDDEIIIYKSGQCDKLTLVEVKCRLEDKLSAYKHLEKQFSDFLLRTNTAESLRELSSHRSITNTIIELAECSIEEIKFSINAFGDTNGQHSPSQSISSRGGMSLRSKSSLSRSKTSSNGTSLLLRHRAKLEAARARLQFAVQEAELQKQKSELESDMAILTVKKDVAVADAELQAMYNELEEKTSRVSLPVPSVGSRQRVQQYLNNLSQGLASYGTDDPPQAQGDPLSSQVAPQSQSVPPDIQLQNNPPDFQVQGDPPNGQVYPSHALADPANVQAHSPQFQGAPPQVQGAPPQFQGAPPQVQGAPPQFQGAPPQFQVDPPQVAGYPLPVPGHVLGYQQVLGHPAQVLGYPQQVLGYPQPVLDYPLRYLNRPSQVLGDPPEVPGDPPEVPGDPPEVPGDPPEVPRDTRRDQDILTGIPSFQVQSRPLQRRVDGDCNNNVQVNDLSKFLLRKDLLISRISRFDDKPESFLSWKSTFRSVMSEMGVSASEEFDLLVKWLGPDSVKHAISLRTSSANNHTEGLKQLWTRLEERYGSAEMIEASLKNKLTSFPKISHRDKKRMYDLCDILSEIQSAKENPKYESVLSYFDTSIGVNSVVTKLPPNFQNKWREKATNYKKSNSVIFPPFEFFVKFVHDLATMLNDPGFVYEPDSGVDRKPDKFPRKQKISVTKTDIVVPPNNVNQKVVRCVIHKANHSLNECRTFKSKSIEDRRKLLKEHSMCFKCLNSNNHRYRDCAENIKCKDCGSNRHSTGMHVDTALSVTTDSARSHGGEKPLLPSSQSQPQQALRQDQSSSTEVININSKCTDVGRSEFNGKSCAKIVLVNLYHRNRPGKYIRAYAILDEQSNKSLAKKELFDFFGIQDRPETYTLSSCAGRVVMSGRRSDGFVIESLDGLERLAVPAVIECDEIPNNREEIPTRDIAAHYPHLHSLIELIPAIDPQADIVLLVGRDLMEAHHVKDQIIGLPNEPYAQQLKLGWVIVGETCIGSAHIPDVISTMKTHLSHRPSVLLPCDSEIYVNNINTDNNFRDVSDSVGASVFSRTKDDNKLGLSFEDKSFLALMEQSGYQDELGNWVAPLPFREYRSKLPNNRAQALSRAKTLDYSLQRNSVKKEHFMNFMQELFDNCHAELAPPLSSGEECWYLPLFGVYHPKKKDSIRGVFDSSARLDGISLNDVLLKGPDLTNSLIGILMRFRKERVAVTADIKKMFYCFLVRPDHRNYLRFLWHKDNNFDMDLVEYRMRVHVFGNSPSPSVSTYFLRKTAEVSEHEFGSDVKEFVGRNFYVDDALSSHSTAKEATDLLTRTQQALQSYGNLRLHKIASNSKEVLSSFPKEDLAKDLMNLDFQNDSLPLQRSLGLSWDIKEDIFKFQIADEEKPFTRRGVLSVLNSIFDPLGFIAPVTIEGKLLLRKFMSKGLDWDDTFQDDDYNEWRKWKESLNSLETLHIPRTYVDTSPSQASRRELHVFADASEKAIATVSYLRVIDQNMESRVGFLFGKTKVAPVSGHTIPRLELCAAVLAVEMTEFSLDQLDLQIDSIKFYTDSRVVLGYIQNESRRFFVYVENRVSRIRKSTLPSQWNYVPTHLNPADQGTRSIHACDLENSLWLRGPIEFLEKGDTRENFNLVDPENDTEIRPVTDVRSAKTVVDDTDLFAIGTNRYERFSSWSHLVRAISVLQKRIHSSKNDIEAFAKAETFIIKSVQHEIYKSEILNLRKGDNLPNSSRIVSLSPYLDSEGILRVGGRINKMSAKLEDKNPVIIPGSHHVATLLIRHYHEKVKHMGRHFTSGAVRSAGIWITGVKRLISSMLYKCVKCRKLRRNVQFQKMADLPQDRLEPSPPFTNVGVDVFGPWPIVMRKTRGNLTTSKRWAVIFSCLVTRAIHIEVIEEMTSSAFINALRRFIAVRGNVKILRSDRGTNFIGATDDLRIDSINVEDGSFRDFLFNTGTVWLFNPPHSSHMGGSWERMIGIVRKILDSMLSNVSGKNLTHDVFVTLMAEVSCIVNARPLVEVSTDPESPFILSPATLLTMKSDHIVKSFPIADFTAKDLFKVQWRRVQCLANTFWSRWKSEYLSTLQGRRKWQQESLNLKRGDVVLLKDKSVHRNEWPLGIVENPIQSADNHVRQAEVRIMRDGKPRVFTRPITEIVLLVSDE